MTVQIRLSKTKSSAAAFAIVDDADADLAQHNWTLEQERHTQYAKRGISLPPFTLRLHRVIAERKFGKNALVGKEVDHIDRDGLNNCRSNLRLATKAQNQMNSRKRTNTASKYRGVFFDTARGKWRAVVYKKGRAKMANFFENEEDADRAYDKLALEHYGEFAKTNFPKEQSK